MKAFPFSVFGIFGVLFYFAAEPFTLAGGFPMKAILAGSLAVALYFAICQLLVARDKLWKSGVRWHYAVAMPSCLLVVCGLLAWVKQFELHWILTQGLPMVIAGCIGSFAGAIVAMRATRNKKVNPTQTR
jgi:hypothetical protein